MYSRWRRRFRSINASSRSPKSSRRPTAGWSRGTSNVSASDRIRGVSIDTRSIEAGALFVALHGAASDGHDYLTQAAARGATAAIVATGRRHPALDCIEVDDTLGALGRLAHRHLERTRAARALPLIAIGGAVGKTTTKELTAAVVRALFGATLSTPGNLNNLIGVPMTIFTLTGEHRAAVLECGTNTRGEIPKLAQIVAPDAAMVLNVDLEHSEGLGTLDDIADEEAALFSTATRVRNRVGRRADGAVKDSKHLRRITFGKSIDAHVRLVSRGAGARSRIRVELARALVATNVEPLIETEIALLGEAAALNCTAAIAGAAAMRAAVLNRAISLPSPQRSRACSRSPAASPAFRSTASSSSTTPTTRIPARFVPRSRPRARSPTDSAPAS